MIVFRTQFSIACERNSMHYVSCVDILKDKKYDCSWCHGFSRPERGLKMPPGTTSPAAPDIATTGSLDFGSVKVKGWVTTFIRCLGIYPPVTIPQRRYQSIDRPQS